MASQVPDFMAPWGFVYGQGWKDNDGGSIRGRVMTERSSAALSSMRWRLATFR
jgi:hypothetical protein